MRLAQKLQSFFTITGSLISVAYADQSEYFRRVVTYRLQGLVGGGFVLRITHALAMPCSARLRVVSSSISCAAWIARSAFPVGGKIDRDRRQQFVAGAAVADLVKLLRDQQRAAF